jgi:FixJ family two-component response regulator
MFPIGAAGGALFVLRVSVAVTLVVTDLKPNAYPNAFVGCSMLARARDFPRPWVPHALLCGSWLRSLDGLELQRRLARKGNPPAIFISDQCDIASTVCAMKAGAIEFLTKPLDLAALHEAITTALDGCVNKRRNWLHFRNVFQR